MSDYKRTTRECAFDALRPELRAAIDAHIEHYNLGEALAGVGLCVETCSEKIKKGLFGGGETTYSAALLTRGWLLWASSGTKTPTQARSARLNQITIQDYSKTNLAKLMPDTGIMINGLQTDTPEIGTIFLPLEENAAGIRFREAVIAAAQAQ